MSELDSPRLLMEQELAISRVILKKLARTTLVQPEQQEIVAARLAEIFVSSRQLYTDVMPSFLELADPTTKMDEDAYEDEVFELFGGVRMHLLHLRDLIEDFEEAFLESLSGRLDAQKGEEGEDDDVV